MPNHHLYYGDGVGPVGTIMTYFLIANMGERRPGANEVGTTVFSVPKGSRGFWADRFATKGAADIAATELLGENRLSFSGHDGDGFVLVSKSRMTPHTLAGGRRRRRPCNTLLPLRLHAVAERRTTTELRKYERY